MFPYDVCTNRRQTVDTFSHGSSLDSTPLQEVRREDEVAQGALRMGEILCRTGLGDQGLHGGDRPRGLVEGDEMRVLRTYFMD